VDAPAEVLFALAGEALAVVKSCVPELVAAIDAEISTERDAES
jgi:hypothetical protein